MNVLGIESSCDETAASVVYQGTQVLSNIISTQIDLHAPFGGVVPEIACRSHLSNMVPVVHECLEQANLTFKEIDLISVTRGPGLLGALLIGTSFAHSLALAQNIPIIGVNHLEAHLCSGRMEDASLSFPFIGLIISGGHTFIVQAKDLGKYQILGRTVDDAVGEAFDKVSSMLGLGYPGGPAIQKAAEAGRTNAFHFPRPMQYASNLDVSFSGLKTAVLYQIKEIQKEGVTLPIADIAASFQQAVIDLLNFKVLKAMEQTQVHQLVIGGGVAANQPLRDALAESCQKKRYRLFLPKKSFCTDNAAMIASLGYYRYTNGLENNPSVKAVDRWSIEDL